ncbi:MAG: PfkB family carbohydrate kinase [Chloroflexi bacterium]|nr:PfkB family carbohydrate kinase [Chloroflexota bacterium]
MTQELRVLPNETPAACWGAGFVAMDVVDMDGEKFATTGGSCGNVMAILAWLGWKARPIARLGADVTGNFIREELSELGVDTGCLTEEARIRSPIVLQRFAKTRDGRRTHRFSLTCPGCGRWLPRYRSITLAQSRSFASGDETPEVFYFDRVSPASLALAHTAKGRGALVVFEPSSVEGEAKFQRAVDSCHVLKYSVERLGHVPDLPFAAFPELIVETQGHLGLRYRWKGRWSHLDSFVVEYVVDAAGSGDWCTAILIHELGRSGAKSLLSSTRRRIAEALECGQAAAAVNCGFCSARGAMQALTLSDLNDRLATLGHNDTGFGHSEICDAPNRSGPLLHYCQQCDAHVRAGSWALDDSA